MVGIELWTSVFLAHVIRQETVWVHSPNSCAPWDLRGGRVIIAGWGWRTPADRFQFSSLVACIESM